MNKEEQGCGKWMDGWRGYCHFNVFSRALPPYHECGSDLTKIERRREKKGCSSKTISNDLDPCLPFTLTLFFLCWSFNTCCTRKVRLLAKDNKKGKEKRRTQPRCEPGGEGKVSRSEEVRVCLHSEAGRIE